MNNLLNFSKMQALGNDFMVINAINQPFLPKKQQIQQWSDRHFGVGFDQMLVIAPAKHPQFDFFYQIFNADGEEVGQCGNGARCVAQFIHRHISPLKQIQLETKTTQMQLSIIDSEMVQLNLPCPRFLPQDIPLQGYPLQNQYELILDEGKTIPVHAVNVGNPHAVIIMNNKQELEQLHLKKLGQQIEHHPAFPEKTNVNFVYIEPSTDIHLRVWERGARETLACGSGAIASAAVVRKFYQLDERIQVHLPGGSLFVEWKDLSGPIVQTGPAIEIFTGMIRKA
jgi:diaminopimelate epimerase